MGFIRRALKAKSPFKKFGKKSKNKIKNAVSVDRTRDLQIFSLTLSQLSYCPVLKVLISAYIYYMSTLYSNMAQLSLLKQPPPSLPVSSAFS